MGQLHLCQQMCLQLAAVALVEAAWAGRCGLLLPVDVEAPGCAPICYRRGAGPIASMGSPGQYTCRNQH